MFFGGNYFARGEFVLYINHSGEYIEIDFNMKIPFFFSSMLVELLSNKGGGCLINLVEFKLFDEFIV